MITLMNLTVPLRIELNYILSLATLPNVVKEVTLEYGGYYLYVKFYYCYPRLYVFDKVWLYLGPLQFKHEILGTAIIGEYRSILNGIDWLLNPTKNDPWYYPFDLSKGTSIV